MKQITGQFRNGKSVGLYGYVTDGHHLQILTVFIITVHAMWSCEQHICSLRSKYGNQLFQACKFLTITNWASEASPTLGCSIEISRDIYIYVVGMSRMSNHVESRESNTRMLKVSIGW